MTTETTSANVIETVMGRRTKLLSQANAALSSLLADPHPGLWAWISAVAHQVDKMSRIMEGEHDKGD